MRRSFCYEQQHHSPNYTGTYFTPMFFRSDDEYIYIAAYEPPFAATTNSGLYRLAKSNLPTYDGLNKIEQDDNVVFNGTSLIFKGKIEQLILCDLNGRTVKYDMNDNVVSLDGLSNNIYLYSAVIDGRKISGKFSVQ